MHFLNKSSERLGKRLQLSDEVARVLEEYHWPGNVRQLQNVIERAVVLADSENDRPARFTTGTTGCRTAANDTQTKVSAFYEIQNEAESVERSNDDICHGSPKSRGGR